MRQTFYYVGATAYGTYVRHINNHKIIVYMYIMTLCILYEAKVQISLSFYTYMYTSLKV